MCPVLNTYQIPDFQKENRCPHKPYCLYSLNTVNRSFSFKGSYISVRNFLPLTFQTLTKGQPFKPAFIRKAVSGLLQSLYIFLSFIFTIFTIFTFLFIFICLPFLISFKKILPIFFFQICLNKEGRNILKIQIKLIIIIAHIHIKH